METYRLKGDGSRDYTTVALLLAYLRTAGVHNYGNPFTEDVEVLFAAGEDFDGDMTGMVNLYDIDFGTGNNRLIFKTDPGDDIASLGLASLTAGYGIGAFRGDAIKRRVRIENMILGAEYSAIAFSGMFQVAGKDTAGYREEFYYDLSSCVILFRAADKAPFFFDDESAGGRSAKAYMKAKMNGCLLVHWYSSAAPLLCYADDVPSAADGLQVYNNLIIFGERVDVLTTDPYNINALVADCKNNTFWDYFYNARVLGTNGVQTGTLNGDPVFDNPILNTRTDTYAAVLAAVRAKTTGYLTALSALCLDNADPVTAPTTDAYGLAREEEAPDRGFFELNAHDTIDFLLAIGDWVRDTAKFRASVYNYVEYDPYLATGKPNVTLSHEDVAGELPCNLKTINNHTDPVTTLETALPNGESSINANIKEVNSVAASAVVLQASLGSVGDTIRSDSVKINGDAAKAVSLSGAINTTHDALRSNVVLIDTTVGVATTLKDALPVGVNKINAQVKGMDADTLTASAVKTDAVAEIQTGLATEANATANKQAILAKPIIIGSEGQTPVKLLDDLKAIFNEQTGDSTSIQ